jgi:Tol biopolymer transport system component
VHRDSGGRPRPYLTTTFDEVDPELSPDGAWLAYTSNDSGVDEVYVSPFPVPSARYRVSTAGGRMPRWGADGRTIFYAGPSTFHAVPFVVAGGDRATLGAPRTIYRRPSVRTWDVTAGGSRLMFIDTVRLLELLGIEVVTGLDPDALARPR